MAQEEDMLALVPYSAIQREELLVKENPDDIQLYALDFQVSRTVELWLEDQEM